ncbi:hypothetical protein WA158_004615 [Blastocystis sp. Blastoise]
MDFESNDSMNKLRGSLQSINPFKKRKVDGYVSMDLDSAFYNPSDMDSKPKETFNFVETMNKAGEVIRDTVKKESVRLVQIITAVNTTYGDGRFNLDQVRAPRRQKIYNEFLKKWSRAESEYLHVALTEFCRETKELYSLSTPYAQTPIPDENLQMHATYTPTPTDSSSGDMFAGMNVSTPDPVEVQKEPVQEEEEDFLFFDSPKPKENRESAVQSMEQDTPSPTTPSTPPPVAPVPAPVPAPVQQQPSSPSLMPIDERIQGCMRDCFEKLVMVELRDITLGVLREKFEEDDQVLYEKMGNLQFLSWEHFDIPEVFRDQEVLDRSIMKLSSISETLSPSEKLDIVVETCQIVGSLLKRKNAAGADDFLPILIFITLKSRTPRLVSTIEYLQHYCNPDILLSEPGYCLTNLSGAVSFLQNATVNDLNIPPQVFCAFYQQSRLRDHKSQDHTWCNHPDKQQSSITNRKDSEFKVFKPSHQNQNQNQNQTISHNVQQVSTIVSIPQPSTQPVPKPSSQPVPKPVAKPEPEPEEDLLFF